MENTSEKLEKILFNDDKAMEAFFEFIKKDKSKNLKDMVEIFIKYAETCLKELSNKEEFGENIITVGMVNGIKRHLTNPNSRFKERCLKNEKQNEDDFCLNQLSENEIDEIINLDSDEIKELSKKQENKSSLTDKEEKLIKNIKKINRFYNMQLKYAHTAKIVLIADEMIKRMEIKNETLRDILYISALFHDVGRFYQTKEHDSFDDGKMKSENKDGYGHSEAGYYYSMMDLFRMNCSKDIGDKELINRIITSFVIKYHSMSNVSLKFLDIDIDEKSVGKIKIEKLEDLIYNMYKEAEFIEFKDEDHKKFIKKFMYEIILEKMSEEKEDVMEALNIRTEEITRELAEEFSENMPEEEEKEFLKKIEDFFGKNQQFIQDIEQNVDTEFLRKTNEYFSNVHKDEDEKEKDAEIEGLVDQLYNAIEKAKAKNVDNYSMGMVNINRKDIKRALENMADYDIAKVIFESFKKEDTDIKEYKAIFSFPLNMVMDADKIDILVQRANKTYPTNYNPEEYKIWDKSGELTLEEIREMFEISEDINIKKGNDGNVTTWNIPVEYVYKYYKKSENQKTGKSENIECILLESDIENFYKFNGMKGKITELGNASANGLSTGRAFLWTINQFIFTNFRAKKSYEIVQENLLLEKAYEQYPEEIQEILKPYMTYALYFIDKISEKTDVLYTAETMQKNCEEIYATYGKEQMYAYQKMFEGKLSENRKKYLADTKKKYTVREIGKAVINVPTTVKKEVEEVENAEKTRDNVKKGEDVGTSNKQILEQNE